MGAELLRSETSSSAENVNNKVLENKGICIFILGKPRKEYSMINDRQQCRRHLAQKKMTQILKMSPTNVLDYCTSSSFLGASVLRSILNNFNSKTRQRTSSCGFPEPLTPSQSAAIMLTRSYTDSDAMLIRKFFGMIPTVKSSRDAR